MIFLTDKDEKVFEEKYSLEDKAYSIYDLHIIIWIKFILNCMLYLCMTTQPPKSFLLIINKIFSNKYLTTTLLKVHESRSDGTKTFYNTYVNFHFFFFFCIFTSNIYHFCYWNLLRYQGLFHVWMKYAKWLWTRYYNCKKKNRMTIFIYEMSIFLT